MITVIDTQASNLQSVCNAFNKVGAETHVTSSVAEVDTADVLVLPGVGAFARAMDTLRKDGLDGAIRRRVLENGVPLLGICLGMQLIAGSSEEHGEHEGLGLVAGRVVELDPAGPNFRVPNIGWYPVQRRGTTALFSETGERPAFYFVHSYHLETASPDDVSATIDFGASPVAAAVEKDNIVAVQFHPEKSQSDGLDLIARFVAFSSERR